MKIVIGLLVLFISVFSIDAGAADIADYLILQNIGRYKIDQPRPFWDEMIGGPTTGQLGNEAEGYYTWYDIGYDGGTGFAAPGAIVRVYDSTQWMLHDLEREHKTSNDAGVALRTDRATTVININNNVVTVIRIGGRAYFWISDNKIVSVEYSDSHFKYPEPVEVLNEYLNKYPSTLAPNYQVRKRDAEWVTEEFDRLLWVAERWVTLIQVDDPKRKEKLTEAAGNLEDFAHYRKAYFPSLFGDGMKADIELLQTAHMGADLETIVRSKLTEYKKWWASHKPDSISLQ